MSCATDDKASFSPGRKLRRIVTAVTTACVLVASTSAWAKPACYSQAEYDAEQAVRLHTELMVIGLTCNSIEADRKLFAKYQEFTTKHRASLMNWEKVLIGHFRETGKSNPTRKFDDFRTIVANEIAQRSALMTPPVFCQSHSDLVDQALRLSDSDLRRYLSDDKVSPFGLAPPCGITVAELLDNDMPATGKASAKPSIQGKSGDGKGAKAKAAKDAAVSKAGSTKPAKTIVTAAKVD